jgi:hypothetical protein
VAVIQARRVESHDEGFTRQQIVRVPAGLYGAMFAWYSLPKTYKKFNSNEDEEKFFCGFVLTHDRTNTQLPHFSEAMITVRPKLFYNEETGMKSAYVSLLFALMGGKKSYSEIMENGETYDLDDLIGRPAMVMIKPNPQSDKDGLYNHRVEAIEPADKVLIHAVKPLWDAKEIVDSTKEPFLKRLKAPTAAFECDVPTGSSAANVGGGYESEIEDDIPF